MPVTVECAKTDPAATKNHAGAGYYVYLPDMPNLAYDERYAQGPTVYYTKEIWHGACLHKTENYIYDGDSLYNMVVWNAAEGKPETVTYGDTRGVARGHATVDATPEVLAAYKAWVKARDEAVAKAKREARIMRALDERKTLIKAAKDNGFKYGALIEARKNWGFENRRAIEKLLTANIRSGFKKSLRQQVIDWLNNADKRFYKLPLSGKQMQYI